MANYSLTRDGKILRDSTPSGYLVARGSYYGTSDDRAAGWYVERDDASMVDRRGRGHSNRQAAFDAFVENEQWMERLGA